MSTSACSDRDVHIVIREGVCRICGCTDDDGCPAGCGWADKDRTICTVCADMAAHLANYVDACRAVSGASLMRLLWDVKGERDDD